MTALFVAGVNHRTAPVEVREGLASAGPEIGCALDAVREGARLSETVIVSTCNRVEVYGVADGGNEAGLASLAALARLKGVDPGMVREHAYVKVDGDAVRHCFRVASSLDSMILGEPQILGQFKDAYGAAQERGVVGTLLHRLMDQALSVAKRVRSETGVAEHAVSVSFAAVELAKKIFGDLAGRTVLLIGAGEMGQLAARHLVDHGVGRLRVTNRTASRAEALATDLGGEAVPFEGWAATLPDTDIVVTAAGAPEPIVTREAVREALQRRRSRPLFFIDIAVPRDVEPAAGDLPDVFCYDVDDLKHVVEANRRERLREAEKAEALVEREAQKFVARLRDAVAVPTIVALRERCESIRESEVARALARLRDVTPETRAAVEALSAAIVNKILHAPTVKLREASRAGGGEHLGAVVAELFALEAGATGRQPREEASGEVTGLTPVPVQ